MAMALEPVPRVAVRQGVEPSDGQEIHPIDAPIQIVAVVAVIRMGPRPRSSEFSKALERRHDPLSAARLHRGAVKGELEARGSKRPDELRVAAIVESVPGEKDLTA